MQLCEFTHIHFLTTEYTYCIRLQKIAVAWRCSVIITFIGFGSQVG